MCKGHDGCADGLLASLEEADLLLSRLSNDKADILHDYEQQFEIEAALALTALARLCVVWNAYKDPSCSSWPLTLTTWLPRQKSLAEVLTTIETKNAEVTEAFEKLDNLTSSRLDAAFALTLRLKQFQSEQLLPIQRRASELKRMVIESQQENEHMIAAKNDSLTSFQNSKIAARELIESLQASHFIKDEKARTAAEDSRKTFRFAPAGDLLEVPFLPLGVVWKFGKAWVFDRQAKKLENQVALQREIVEKLQSTWHSTRREKTDLEDMRQSLDQTNHVLSLLSQKCVALLEWTRSMEADLAADNAATTAHLLEVRKLALESQKMQFSETRPKVLLVVKTVAYGLSRHCQRFEPSASADRTARRNLVYLFARLSHHITSLRSTVLRSGGDTDSEDDFLVLWSQIEHTPSCILPDFEHDIGLDHEMSNWLRDKWRPASFLAGTFTVLALWLMFCLSRTSLFIATALCGTCYILPKNVTLRVIILVNTWWKSIVQAWNRTLDTAADTFHNIRKLTLRWLRHISFLYDVLVFVAFIFLGILYCFKELLAWTVRQFFSTSAEHEDKIDADK